ncbi:metal ABC transporter solute-binding protein, Zn/Mn family [Merismopedia glauca]|uniref:Metal ABC transporter substrate-binding protein n=1 Tax=Merismopedia glauca CCAP 1448/3 TaxID=1296344 RepID=A0A2T1C7Y1_9CYAN|nr:zinc ABC transporter substrate-binding protein [Merismopedia glauca]PSB04247.1 metal ABC transporter substrate-binding protein [Merismopedia glauca CCAP 1448/3]
MLVFDQKSLINPFSKIIALYALLISTGCNSLTQTNSNNNPSIGGGEKPTNSASNQNLPVVVATTSVLCDLTKQIAATTVDLKCLIQAGQDPHTYQPTSGDRKSIETAKLIFYAGYDFDPSLAKLVKSSNNPAPKIAVHEVAVPQPLYGEGDEHKHEHQAEKTEGKTPDPHVWHNAQNGIRMIATIRDNLTQISPNNETNYHNNAQQITNELQQIDTWIKSEIQTIPAQQRNLVTTHDALGYYTNAYGLNFEGALSGLSTEQQPTAARVGELVKEIKSTKVPTIFAEVTVNPKLIKTVAKEAKVQLSNREIFADGLGEPNSEGDTYQKMLVANTQTIVEGLGGKYTPFVKKP